MCLSSCHEPWNTCQHKDPIQRSLCDPEAALSDIQQQHCAFPCRITSSIPNIIMQ